MDRNAIVETIIDWNSRTWKLDLIRPLLLTEEAFAIQRIPIESSSKVDCLVWPDEKNGKYLLRQQHYGRAANVLRSGVTTWFVSSRILWSLSKVFVALLVEGVGLCTQFLPSSAMSNDILKSAGGIGPPGIVIKRRIILRRWHY
ncbi:unnamed protein product [Prunus brigantina]